MIFTDKAEAGKSVMNVDVPEKDRNRFSITDEEITELAHYALTIEKHYGRPMDIEWGRDGLDGKLYILQARPETVKSQEEGGRNLRRFDINGDKKRLVRRPRHRSKSRSRQSPLGKRRIRNGFR